MVIFTLFNRLFSLVPLAGLALASWLFQEDVTILRQAWWLPAWTGLLVLVGFTSQKWFWPAKRSSWRTFYARLASVVVTASIGYAGHSLVDFVQPHLQIQAVCFMVASALSVGLNLHCLVSHSSPTPGRRMA
jgi:hypothetical protein